MENDDWFVNTIALKKKYDMINRPTSTITEQVQMLDIYIEHC